MATKSLARAGGRTPGVELRKGNPAKASGATSEALADELAASRQSSEPLRFVCLGGGTGLAVLLQGLKAYVYPPYRPAPRLAPDNRFEPAEITAIVTVTDDGGSSGRLRREFSVLPPGDIRNCIVALAEDEDMLSHLLQYRFGSGHGLKGHSFGNLFLTALTRLTGDFQQAVQVSSEVLAIRGRIFPSTAMDVGLLAELENGRTVHGESRIGRSRSRIRALRLSHNPCQPLPETLEAIARADLITLGPGSLYTSVIPHLLMNGVPQALAASRAVKAYVCNLMSQPGESIGYTAADHLRAILAHAGVNHARRPLLDYVIVNSRKAPPRVIHRYSRHRAHQVETDWESLSAQRVQVLAEDLLAEGPVVRHHPARLAALLVGLARQGKMERLGS